ncbi:hypothetical protein ACFV42_46525 [Streptomyces solisilvae]|uniref:hypothetical protein n=1 Tax=Streptomyces malaysiensis TaxID=92644 RepID=UPI0036C228C1
MTAEETYPGELEALRGLLGEVRTIAGHGTVEDLHAAVQQHDEEERAALEVLPWVPQLGALYLVPGTDGEPDRVVRVIAEGLWRRKMDVVWGGEIRHTYTRSTLRYESEDNRARKVGVSRAGRLVLATTGGRVMGHAAEIKALRTFELPQIPPSAAAVARALGSVQEAAKTAGLLMNVKGAEHLKEFLGESYG